MASRYEIFRLAADYPVGGRPTYGLQPNMYYLSHEQSKLGHQVIVIARRQKSQPAFELDGEIEVHRVGNPFNVNSYRLLRELHHRPRDSRLPLIHTHSTSGVFASVMKRPLGLPLFAHVHGASRSRRMPQRLKGLVDQDFSASKMWYYYFRERLYWSSSDRVLAVSNALKEDLIDYYKIRTDKISVVYNGVDTNLFRANAGDMSTPAVLKPYEGRPIILYVGHFGPRKGLIFLIRAMQRVVKEVPDAVAVCVGGVPAWLGKQNYWSYLDGVVRQLDLSGKILLLDRVANHELPAFYSRANVFTLPSFYEAFAKVVLEAMACETPVIVTREGGPQEIVEEGKMGLLVDYGSVRELAEAIIQILKDEGKARRMGREARNLVARDFTWKAVATRINSVYDEVCEK